MAHNELGVAFVEHILKAALVKERVDEFDACQVGYFRTLVVLCNNEDADSITVVALSIINRLDDVQRDCILEVWCWSC